jgi:hypothetical protein
LHTRREVEPLEQGDDVNSLGIGRWSWPERQTTQSRSQEEQRLATMLDQDCHGGADQHTTSGASASD